MERRMAVVNERVGARAAGAAKSGLRFASCLLLAPAFVPVCLAVALGLRIAWMLAFDPQPISDFSSYYRYAVSLINGQGYSVDGRSTAYFPPGYSAWLSGIFLIFGPSVFAAKCANVLLQGASLLLTYLIARRLFASEAVDRLALLIYALHPNSIAYAGLLASENLFIALMLLGFFILLRSEKYGSGIAAGLVFGCAALTRVQGLLLPLLYFVLILPAAVRQRAVAGWARRCLLAHVALVLVMLPWVTRNYLIFHRPLITTTTGVNLFIGNNPDANGEYVWTAHMSAMLPPSTDEASADRACAGLACRFIREHPERVIFLLPRKLHVLYLTDWDGIQWTQLSLGATTPAQTAVLWNSGIIAQRYYRTILWLFVIAVPLLIVRRRYRPFPWLGIAIIGYFTMIHLATFSVGRYHLPMLPWMMIYIAAISARRSDN
jgi:4-amino-4-deoxy-L-arabinose transferase-like glycosyltransferase